MSDQELATGEMTKNHFPEIQIPEYVQADLRQGVQTFIETPSDDGPASLVVTLDRSGTLFYNAVSGYATTHGLTLPATISASIGTEIHGRYVDERSADEECDYDGTELEYYLDINTSGATAEEIRTNFYEWLKTNLQAQKAIEKLTSGFTQAQAKGQLKKLRVVDEWSYRGTSLGITTPLIIAESLKQAGILPDEYAIEDLIKQLSHQRRGDYSFTDLTLGDITLSRQTLLKNNWQTGILAPLIDEIGLPEGVVRNACSRFFSELLKGQVESDDGELVPIETREDIIAIGERTSKHTGGENPAIFLLDKYGEEPLLRLHQSMQEKIFAVGTDMSFRAMEASGSLPSEESPADAGTDNS